MKKIIYLSSFFLFTPIFIFVCILTLSYSSFQKNGKVLGANTTGIAYAALPPTENGISETITAENSKEEIVRQFFAKYKSPLEPYAPDIIVAADRYGLDYRLLPAIAMQESNLCRRVIPDSHNCWGWGIYGTKVTKFNNFPEAIETISKTLALKYKEKHGLVTPYEIGKMYNPSNTNNWAESVTHFMNELK
jgi:hypothetical protein